MARPKTKSSTEATRDYQQKAYDFKRIKARKEWEYAENMRKAAEIAGESINSFILKATVERARSLGVPFENGPFFDDKSADMSESGDT